MAKGKRLIKMASCVFCPDNLQSQSTRRATLHYKSLQYSLHKYNALLNDALQNDSVQNYSLSDDSLQNDKVKIINCLSIVNFEKRILLVYELCCNACLVKGIYCRHIVECESNVGRSEALGLRVLDLVEGV